MYVVGGCESTVPPARFTSVGDGRRAVGGALAARVRRDGIDGVSIASNDLTQLMLGVDRDSDVCAELFDEAGAAVLDAIGQIVGTARRLGITSSLCGQARNRPSPSTWCRWGSPPSR
jgi:PEP-utilising enzyme, PEP-binding domain